MDFLTDAFDNIKQTFNKLVNKTQNAPSSEQTAAPFNSHTLQFDITAKPVIKFIPAGQIDGDGEPPKEFRKIINDLLNSFKNGTDQIAVPTKKLKGGVAGTITTFDVPEKNGHTLVKIVEDATGRTVEVLHESETDIPEGVKQFAKDVTDVFTTTEAEAITKDNSGTAPSFINVYIIAALTLIIIITLSIGGIMWCKKNRVKMEKRNDYPVLAAANNEYMDPQTLRSNDKMKSVP